MVTTINLKITLESLTESITSLNLKQKRQLLEMLQQQIFEEEEANYEDDTNTIAEIEAVQAEYETGDYLTFDDYLKKGSNEAS